MDNIIARPEATDDVPSQLYGSLGSFWTRLYEDKDLIRRLTQGMAIIAEQLKIEYDEAKACLGREGAPTAARVKYQPLVINRSGANTGKTVKFTFGMQPPVNIGPQAEGSAYQNGAEFSVGGLAPLEGFVAYPLIGASPDQGITAIADRMVSPRVLMVNGVDFRFQDGSIVFKESRDPFGPLLIGNFQTTLVKGIEPDTQMLLWGFEALYDKEYLKDHFGHLYPGAPSDLDYYKEVLNASGDLYVGGSNILNTKLSLARLFVTPAAIEEETITEIVSESDGSTLVITPGNFYRIRPEETILPHIVEGYVLTPGEFMTTTLKIYFNINPTTFFARNGYPFQQFKQDFPELKLRQGVASVSGLSLTWDEVPIIYEGNDKNGNPQYSFPVSNDQQVTDEFWSFVLARSEDQGINMYDLLADHISLPEASPNSVVGSISPADYFVRNLLYANASAMVVDFDALPQYIKDLDVYQVIAATSAVYTSMFITIQSNLTEEAVDLEESSSESLTSIPAGVVSDVAGEAGSLTYYDVTVKTRRVLV